MLLRKTSAYMLAAIISIILFTGFRPVYAEGIYPLEDGETLIEESLIDDNRVEIFTRIGEETYVKKLQKNGGQWTVESTEAIKLRGTGLLIKESDKKGDRMLASALERELDSYGLEAASLPPVIDYSQSQFLPPIGDQGLRNSCVGWSTGYYLRTYQQARDIGWEVEAAGNRIDSHVFSPTFIYNQIRQSTPNPDDDDDGGAYISDAGDLLVGMGAATLTDFPYSTNNITILPNDTEKLWASSHKIRQWTLLYADANTDQWIIDKTREYLNTGDLVVAGSRIGSEFILNRYKDQYGNSIIIREDASPFGHAFIVVGYNDNLVTPDGIGAFKIINSWGEDWGNGGFSYISYREFAYNAVEGYVFTDILDAKIQELAVDLNDCSLFNMNFTGSGRFDIEIKDSGDGLVYKEDNLRGVPGINHIEWNGRDMAGNKVADGTYKLSIIPYKGDTPKPAFRKDFNKSGRVIGASAQAYSYENVINYVNIPITFKSDCFISIKVDYNGQVHEVIPAWPVNAGESDIYTIHKTDFDFNNKDLSKVKIIIDIF